MFKLRDGLILKFNDSFYFRVQRIIQDHYRPGNSTIHKPEIYRQKLDDINLSEYILIESEDN